MLYKSFEKFRYFIDWVQKVDDVTSQMLLGYWVVISNPFFHNPHSFQYH